MKRVSTIAVLAAFFGSAALANAADVYEPGGLKDDIVGGQYTPDYRQNNSGIYINGHLGFTRIDRSGTGSITGSKNELLVTDGVDDDGNPIFVTATDENLEDGDPLFVGDNIFTDFLTGSSEDELDKFVYGGGLSYLYHRGRFGLEIGLEGSFYSNNETKRDFVGAPTITNLNTFGEGIYGDVGDDQLYGQLGSVSFERNYDIDLILKGHYFPRPDISLFVGAGPSWANASAKGSHVSNYHEINSAVAGAVGVLDNSFDQDDNSLGFALVAGINWWADENVVVGAEAFYKRHEFDFGSSSTSNDTIGGSAYQFKVSDELEVEDEQWGIKARAAVKLN